MHFVGFPSFCKLFSPGGGVVCRETSGCDAGLPAECRGCRWLAARRESRNGVSTLRATHRRIFPVSTPKGNSATGTLCPVHNSEFCTSCGVGFRLTGCASTANQFSYLFQTPEHWSLAAPTSRQRCALHHHFDLSEIQIPFKKNKNKIDGRFSAVSALISVINV